MSKEKHLCVDARLHMFTLQAIRIQPEAAVLTAKAVYDRHCLEGSRCTGLDQTKAT